MKENKAEKSILQEESKVNQVKNIIIKNKEIFIYIIIIFVIIIALGVFLLNKIPSKYYGNYVRYTYNEGIENKITYKITPFSIKSTLEISGKDNKKSEKKYKYYKRGNDLIIKEDDGERYVIIDDNCLYIESSKDISKTKKNELFYWNEKSEHADIYEIKNKSKGFKSLLETIINLWAREAIYNNLDAQIDNNSFYILESDEKSDETDLNTYKVNLKACGGNFTLSYDRKNKNLKNVGFSGTSDFSSNNSIDYETMSVNDFYDSFSMLLASMYLVGNKENIKLNKDINNKDKAVEASNDYVKLLSNKTENDRFEGLDTFSLNNEKYDISVRIYSMTSNIGHIGWNIDIID